jgi:anti-sigma B factor antagonist
MAEFQIRSSKQDVPGAGNVHVLNLRGSLDAHTFLGFQKELESALRSGDLRIVLDCDGLDYMSSAGLGVLKKYVHDFRERGGDLRIARVPEKIDNIIKLLGFSKVFKIFAKLDEAVSSYKP